MIRVYDEAFRNKFQNISLEVYGIGITKKWEKSNLLNKNLEEKISWAYDIGGTKDVYFEDGNAFWLSINEAKLYIWNSCHNAYARLGADRIMAMRERYRKSEIGEDICEQMQIYYKGILLSKTEFQNDANLIEYVDLKETLNSDYIRLNRNGLSEEGYRYLEEVYSDIIVSAKKALRYFGAKEGHKYMEDIKGGIDFLVSQKNKSEFSINNVEKYFLSAAALAYFAMIEKQEDYIPELRENGVGEWNEILQHAKTAILKLKETVTDENDICSYWRQSFLHNIPVWTSGERFKHEGIDIMEFLQRKNKFAILSTREGSNKALSEYLIRLDKEEYEQNILKNIQNLRKEYDGKKRTEYMLNMKKYASEIMNRNYLEFENRDLEEERKSHLVLKWMLKNIPSIALFASLDGNIRLNILGIKVTGSIYADTNMKILTLKRMEEVYRKDNIERFSLPVWSGYHHLALGTIPPSVKHIKRGKFADCWNDRMIFPLTGKELCRLSEECDQLLEPVEKLISELCENAIEGVYQYVIKEMKENSEDEVAIDGRFWSLTEQKLSEDITEEQIVFDDLKTEAEKVKLTEQDQKNIVRNLQSEDENKIIVFEKFGKVCHIIRKLLIYYNTIVLSEDQMETYEATREFENMIQYVSENSNMALSKERVRHIYKNYIYECVDEYLVWKREKYLSRYHSVIVSKANI